MADANPDAAGTDDPRYMLAKRLLDSCMETDQVRDLAKYAVLVGALARFDEHGAPSSELARLLGELRMSVAALDAALARAILVLCGEIKAEIRERAAAGEEPKP